MHALYESRRWLVDGDSYRTAKPVIHDLTIVGSHDQGDDHMQIRSSLPPIQPTPRGHDGDPIFEKAFS